MQDRFKFRIWNKNFNQYSSIGLDTALTVNNISEDFVIQQCLGVKDKTGRLIYEWDLLLDITKEIYEIYWYGIGFHLKHINSKNAVVTNLNKLKVIGSIADNKLVDLNGKILDTLTTIEETLNLLGV